MRGADEQFEKLYRVFLQEVFEGVGIEIANGLSHVEVDQATVETVGVVFADGVELAKLFCDVFACESEALETFAFLKPKFVSGFGSRGDVRRRDAGVAFFSEGLDNIFVGHVVVDGFVEEIADGFGKVGDFAAVRAALRFWSNGGCGK